MSEFSYPVLSDEEFESQRKILEPGIYGFEVINAEMTTTQFSGAPSLQVDFKVWDVNGKEHSFRDWFEGTKESAYKIKAFWESVGKPENYASGKAATHDFIGQCGKLKIYHKKDKENKIRPRIGGYVKPETKVEMKSAKSDGKDFPDEDIPF